MKAWLIDGLTSVDQLRLAEVPDPVPRADEVVLEAQVVQRKSGQKWVPALDQEVERIKAPATRQR